MPGDFHFELYSHCTFTHHHLKFIFGMYVSYNLRINRFVLQNALFDEHDHIAEVDSPRANQHALATEHTFLDFRFEFNRFATAQQQVHSPDIEADQISSAASGGASAARKAHLERGFHFQNLIQ